MISDRTDGERALKAWPSRNLEQLVDDLSLLGRRWRAGEPVRVPRVTVWLRSGATAVGEVVDLHQDRSGTRTLVLRVQTGEPAQVDVLHLSWAALDAVTVHDLATLDKPPEALAASPTRAQLERRAADVTEALAQKVGTPIAFVLEATEHLEPLDWLLRQVEEVLLELAQDQRFADAMRGRVRQIKLGLSVNAGLVFADGVLTFTTPTGWNKRTTREALERELRALL
jgi:hypothetical protein